MLIILAKLNMPSKWYFQLNLICEVLINFLTTAWFTTIGSTVLYVIRKAIMKESIALGLFGTTLSGPSQ